MSRWYNYFLGIRQRHAYWAYKVIDDILNENRQIQGIIEIGTLPGSMSVFLGLECYERGLKSLLTYDIRGYPKDDEKSANLALPKNKMTGTYKPRLFKLLEIRFIIRNCFHKNSVQEIIEYANVPILFFCDGGNKIREFNYFAGLLKQDSIIVAHDWNEEIKLEDISDTINKYGLIPLHEKEWDVPPDNIKTCFWRKMK